MNSEIYILETTGKLRDVYGISKHLKFFIPFLRTTSQYSIKEITQSGENRPIFFYYSLHYPGSTFPVRFITLMSLFRHFLFSGINSLPFFALNNLFLSGVLRTYISLSLHRATSCSQDGNLKNTRGANIST